VHRIESKLYSYLYKLKGEEKGVAILFYFILLLLYFQTPNFNEMFSFKDFFGRSQSGI
jgi:hypothetical protein